LLNKVSGGQNIYSSFAEDYNPGSHLNSKYKRFLTSSLKK